MRNKLILLSTLLASCSYLSSPVLSPYKMDIRQGNYITAEMREKLKLGMSKSQVRYVLGTPMISDAFHGNRWDYPYRLEQRGEVIEKQLLTLLFDGENLVKIDDGKTVEIAPPSAKQVVVAQTAKPTVQIDHEAEVLKSVQGWAAAWSARNVVDYLAAYSADFKPDGLNRDVWEKQRRERIGKQKNIEVKLRDINVSMVNESQAMVSFTQDYRSDGYRDQVEKTLKLVKQSGIWQIAEEHASKAAKASAGAQVYVPATVGSKTAGQQAVRDAVGRWADAWSTRDIAKYLASYGPAFKPKGMDKAAWEKQRKERIADALSIEVKISDLNIKQHDDVHASATFIQDYRSNHHKDRARKTLLLEKVGDVWLIMAEQVAK